MQARSAIPSSALSSQGGARGRPNLPAEGEEEEEEEVIIMGEGLEDRNEYRKAMRSEDKNLE